MFTYHTKDTAPEESKPQIEQSVKIFGFFPKLHQIMAEAPITYEIYNSALAAVYNRSTLPPIEQEVVMMTASYENRCHYCTAGHTMMMKMKHAPIEVINALRDGTPFSDSKLEAFRSFTRLLLEKRGHVGDAELQKFLDAGYTKRQALEILTGLAAKLISNFTNALAHTELDDPIKPLAWKHPSER